MAGRCSYQRINLVHVRKIIKLALERLVVLPAENQILACEEAGVLNVSE